MGANSGNMFLIEARRSLRGASTANRQNHWRQAQPAGAALSLLWRMRSLLRFKFPGIDSFFNKAMSNEIF